MGSYYEFNGLQRTVKTKKEIKEEIKRIISAREVLLDDPVKGIQEIIESSNLQISVLNWVLNEKA